MDTQPMDDDATTQRKTPTPRGTTPKPIPSDAYSSEGDVIAGEPGMPEMNAALERERLIYRREPRTGIGTPDEYAEAGGAELGGDTGDVGTPRNEIENTLGGTAGTGYEPNTSSVTAKHLSDKGIARPKRRTA
jgi:hypothetical protein